MWKKAILFVPPVMTFGLVCSKPSNAHIKRGCGKCTDCNGSWVWSNTGRKEWEWTLLIFLPTLRKISLCTSDRKGERHCRAWVLSCQDYWHFWPRKGEFDFASLQGWRGRGTCGDSLQAHIRVGLILSLFILPEMLFWWIEVGYPALSKTRKPDKSLCVLQNSFYLQYRTWEKYHWSHCPELRPVKR